MDKNEYHREYNKRRYHERRKIALQFLGGKCENCGTTEDLHIDHVDRNQKKYEFTYITRLTQYKFFEELFKCWLLCKRCHERKTGIEMSIEHGEGLTGKKNCFCEKCAPLKTKYMKQYMENYRKL